MADLFLTSFTPARGSGRGQRSCSIIRALARHGPVRVAYVPFGGEQPAADLVADANVELVPIVPSRGVGRVLSILRALAAGAPVGLARTVSPELIAAARSAAPGDRVIADGPNVATALIGLARRRSLIYAAQNIESSFRPGERLRRFERKILRRFAESWMCTRGDVVLGEQLGGADVATRLREVPNVVDLALLAQAPPAPGGQRLLFVADFRYPPNREALTFLEREVLPILWRDLPEATIDVVGRGLEEVARDPRVHVHGFVDSLDTLYAEADVAVVPLLTGGGSPLKLIEALGRGAVVVTTAHAAALLEHGTIGEHFLTGTDGPSLAAAIARALAHPDPGMGARARVLIARHLSLEALTPLVAPAAPHAIDHRAGRDRRTRAEPA
jgi:hypothetical protein